MYRRPFVGLCGKKTCDCLNTVALLEEPPLRSRNKDHGRDNAGSCAAEKRTWLEDAKVVSLALDDRNKYTLIRFACDIGLAPPQASTELGSHHGILAVFDGSLAMTEEDLDEDYAVRVVAKVRLAVE